MNISGIPIGSGHPVVTVAEISNAHNGDFDRCIRILDAIKPSGATFAKFQCYTPDELVQLRGDGPAPEPWGGQGWTMRKLYEKAQTPHEWFPSLVEHCKAIGLPWFASVFGGESLALLEWLGCPAYKIASLDRDAANLRASVLATGKPILASLPSFVERPHWNQLTLYCPPGYPQTDIRLGDLRYMEHVPNYDGLSYHGTHPLVPVYAVVAGARIVECHFQLDEEPSELESNVSLSATQFGTMVREIQKVEAML